MNRSNRRSKDESSNNKIPVSRSIKVLIPEGEQRYFVDELFKQEGANNEEIDLGREEVSLDASMSDGTDQYDYEGDEDEEDFTS